VDRLAVLSTVHVIADWPVPLPFFWLAAPVAVGAIVADASALRLADGQRAITMSAALVR